MCPAVQLATSIADIRIVEKDVIQANNLLTSLDYLTFYINPEWDGFFLMFEFFKLKFTPGWFGFTQNKLI